MEQTNIMTCISGASEAVIYWVVEQARRIDHRVACSPPHENPGFFLGRAVAAFPLLPS